MSKDFFLYFINLISLEKLLILIYFFGINFLNEFYLLQNSARSNKNA